MAWTEITRPRYQRDHLRYASGTSDDERMLLRLVRKRRLSLKIDLDREWHSRPRRFDALRVRGLEQRHPHRTVIRLGDVLDLADTDEVSVVGCFSDARRKPYR